jgi:vWA-MoxR associated protein C-terminal domain/vWA-MoxR associated protein middle region (VMAP-M) 1/Trypsin-like peptidase domain
MSDFEGFKSSIARIFSGKTVIGAGFLIADRYLITCAHVVTAALKLPRNTLELPVGNVEFDFPLLAPGQRVIARAVFWRPVQPGQVGEDQAVLEISVATLPQGTQSVEVVAADQPWGHPFRIFGFPQDRDDGIWASGVLRDYQAAQWVQMEDITAQGYPIESGFSGAPVWDEALGGVVGMAVAAERDREEAKAAFMIPTRQLDKAQQFIRQQTLLSCLEREQQSLGKQMTTAYNVCRPDGWSHPYQNQLRQRLADLSRMTDGELQQPMLVQFVACLLNQAGLTDAIRQALERWAKRYTADLDGLRDRLRDKQTAKFSSPATQLAEPYLLVSVKPHEVKPQHSYVSAWLISDANHYDAETGQGSDKLEMQNSETQKLNSDSGVPDDQIPEILADYLNQVGKQIDVSVLTVELLLPLTLINQPIEQLAIPSELDFDVPEALTNVCRHIVVRSQDRLVANRSLGRWQSKWRQVEALLDTKAGSRFISGMGDAGKVRAGLKPDDKLGLQLTRPLDTGRGGDLASLIATGTPIALWVRQDKASADWGRQFAHQIFGCFDPSAQVVSEGQSACCLASPCQLVSHDSTDERMDGCSSVQLRELRDKVAHVRQNASKIHDSNGNLDQSLSDQSLELGHHLSFLWENPKRVPPKIIYS